MAVGMLIDLFFYFFFLDWDCCIDCSCYLLGCCCFCAIFLCCLPIILIALFLIYVPFPPLAILLLANSKTIRDAGTWKFIEKEGLYERADPTSSV